MTHAAPPAVQCSTRPRGPLAVQSCRSNGFLRYRGVEWERAVGNIERQFGVRVVVLQCVRDLLEQHVSCTVVRTGVRSTRGAEVLNLWQGKLSPT